MSNFYNLCECCAMNRIDTPAITTRFWHHAFGFTACRNVALCGECAYHSDMAEEYVPDEPWERRECGHPWVSP